MIMVYTGVISNDPYLVLRMKLFLWITFFGYVNINYYLYNAIKTSTTMKNKISPEEAKELANTLQDGYFANSSLSTEAKKTFEYLLDRNDFDLAYLYLLNEAKALPKDLISIDIVVLIRRY